MSQARSITLNAFSLLLVFAATAVTSDAGESRVELTDGSSINAELIGIDGGNYLLRSPTLGEIRVPEASIRAIRPLASGAEGSTPPGSPAGGQVGEVAGKLLADPRLLEMVEGLRNDPELQSALADPEFMRLVMAGDYQSLSGDPRMQRLMANPAILAIIGEMSHR